MSAARSNHVLHTWESYRTVPPLRLLSDPWPKVLPVYEDERHERLTNDAEGRSNLAWLSSLSAYDEIRTYTDVATLLRRGVELLRETSGVERAAIFLLRKDQTLTGTFGTGVAGETTDERHIAFALGDSHRQAFTLANHGLARWSRFSGVPLFAQHENKTVVVRHGENIIVPIPSPSGCLGLIACDWGLSGATTAVGALLRTAVFARILSPLLVNVSPGETPARGESAAQQLVGDAVRRLRADPNEDRHVLAKSLGTTADRLGRVFKAETGESLLEYRNRLRLERFFCVVDPAGGNLLRAAFEAGFGSYAQFHRVFHEAFDCAPIDYLKREGPRRQE